MVSLHQHVFPAFQPVVEIASGRVVGHEVLARTIQADHSIVSAGLFLNNPVYDRDDRLRLDRQVRRAALEKFIQQPHDQYLALNISPEWIDALPSFDVLPTLEMIAELGVDPSRIVVEFTEGSGDIGRIQKLASLYREAGIRVALDDFGSGFQQIDRLLAFAPDIIKLDLRLFREGSTLTGLPAMKMIGEMAVRMGCEVVCEGVETPQDFYHAVQCNAAYIQGYLFQKAEMDFAAPNAYREDMSGLLQHYFREITQNAVLSQNRLNKLMQDVKSLETMFSSSDPNLQDFPLDGSVIRLYLCDLSGIQISPNYERFGENEWYVNPSRLGCNWSWRPYFYELIAARDLKPRILRSSVYRDITSGINCFTLSLLVNDNQVLLVDVRSEEYLHVLDYIPKSA